VPQPRVADEIFVYAREGAELRDFLALVERFNRRSANPTRWRPVVTTADDPLGRLVEERRGDVVILAGRNGGKAHTIRRLHESGFHVLADKPWLVEPGDLEHVRASLDGWPLAAEIMTGRHDVAAGLVKRLVGAAEIFGNFRADAPAIEQESVHHLEKLVDGAPLRRPWWFFDVGAQGSGPVDIPTHVVDQAQWLVDDDAVAPVLLSARAWSTRVPAEAFRRITGEARFPRELEPFVDGDTLNYRCNAELVYQIGRVTASAATRWNLVPSSGGGDVSHSVAQGTRADVSLEQSARTDHHRRVFLEPRTDAGDVARALRETVMAWQAELPGVEVVPAGPETFEVTVPPPARRRPRGTLRPSPRRVPKNRGRSPLAPRARRAHARQVRATRRSRGEDYKLRVQTAPATGAPSTFCREERQRTPLIYHST
jgi:predicted dehydrogenase